MERLTTAIRKDNKAGKDRVLWASILSILNLSGFYFIEQAERKTKKEKDAIIHPESSAVSKPAN